MVSSRHNKGNWRHQIAAARGGLIAIALVPLGASAPAGNPAQYGAKAAEHSDHGAKAHQGDAGQATPVQKQNGAGGADAAAAQAPAKHNEEGAPKWTDVAMALSALASAFFALVLAAFTWRLIIVGRLQHRAMIRSNVVSRRSIRAAMEGNRLAREALIAANRPWLAITEIKIGALKFTEAGAVVVEVQAAIQNLGASPATSVRVEWALIALPTQPDLVMAEIRERHMSLSIGFPGDVVFPGITRPPQNRWNVIKLDSVENKDFLALYLVGIVSYQFAFTETIHITPVTGQVLRVGKGRAVFGQDLDSEEVTFHGPESSGQRPT